MEIKTKERREKDGITFFPVLTVPRELIIDGKFLLKLSRNLQERDFHDFFLKEDDSSIVIWIPVDAAKHITGTSCSRISVDVYWSKGEEGQYYL